MNRAIQTLSEVVKEAPFKEKLLFVPSYSIGHQIGESLSRSGTSWSNLRVTTVSGYAQELMALDGCLSSIRMGISEMVPFDLLGDEKPSLSKALINSSDLRIGSLPPLIGLPQPISFR